MQINTLTEFLNAQKNMQERTTNTQQKRGTALVYWGQDNQGNKYLKKDGDVAIVRFNISSDQDPYFIEYHRLGAAQNWKKVACLGDNCPLCKLDSSNPDSKKTRRMLLPVKIAYLTAAGTFTAPVSTVWDLSAPLRSSGPNYPALIAEKLHDFGDLREVVFKVKRLGEGLSTTYDISYVPNLNNENIINKDFSDFEGLHYDKFVYWKYTCDELISYIQTGELPKQTSNNVTSNQSESENKEFAISTSQPTYTNNANYSQVATTANTSSNTIVNPFRQTPTVTNNSAADSANEYSIKNQTQDTGFYFK